ncbi:MAG: DUF6516 family protein [Thiobacillus sp.]|nr:DUF6516 family protein [Thiobacillus sp.]
MTPCGHTFKYRLVYALDGKRLVGFDNECGKGDHKHLDGKESAYRFVSVDRLLDDFIAEVERRVE